MLSTYKRIRVRSHLWRTSTIERYLTHPLFGVVGALSMHWWNWIWFNQKNAYEPDGPEKEAKWRKHRGDEIYRHYKIAFNFLAFGAVVYAFMKLRRKYFWTPRMVGTYDMYLIDLSIGLPIGGIPVELIYGAWAAYDKRRANQMLQNEINTNID